MDGKAETHGSTAFLAVSKPLAEIDAKSEPSANEQTRADGNGGHYSRMTVVDWTAQKVSYSRIIRSIFRMSCSVIKSAMSPSNPSQESHRMSLVLR